MEVQLYVYDLSKVPFNIITNTFSFVKLKYSQGLARHVGFLALSILCVTDSIFAAVDPVPRNTLRCVSNISTV